MPTNLLRARFFLIALTRIRSYTVIMNTLENVRIRPAHKTDFEAMLNIFKAVIANEDSYVFAPDTPREDIFEYWFRPSCTSYVAEDRGWILGMYKLFPNQRDLGSHIAGASFMVAPGQQGRGIGKMMGFHCLKEAKNAGFAALQFNYVISSNEASVRLWKKLGFSIIGTIPSGFKHAKLGFVDVYIMYRSLDDIVV